MPFRPPSTHTLFTTFATLACVVLSVQVVRLSRENTRLKAAPEAMEKAEGGALAVGEILPPLTALGPTGAPAPSAESNYLTLRDGRLATVVLAMGGACETCSATKPYFESLARDHAGGGVIFVAVEVDTGKPQDLHASGAVLPNVMVEQAETTWLRRVPLVPAVILIDGEGAVRRTWFGSLSDRQRTEFEAELANARSAWKNQKSPRRGPPRRRQ